MWSALCLVYEWCCINKVRLGPCCYNINCLIPHDSEEVKEGSLKPLHFLSHRHTTLMMGDRRAKTKWLLSFAMLCTCYTYPEGRVHSHHNLDSFNHLISDLCRHATWHPGRLCSAAHVSILRPRLQAADVPEGTHQISSREERGELHLLVVPWLLQPAHPAGTSHDLTQALPRPGKTQRRLPNPEVSEHCTVWGVPGAVI